MNRRCRMPTVSSRTASSTASAITTYTAATIHNESRSESGTRPMPAHAKAADGTRANTNPNTGADDRARPNTNPIAAAIQKPTVKPLPRA